jgi:hypothetical protein
MQTIEFMLRSQRFSQNRLQRSHYGEPAEPPWRGDSSKILSIRVFIGQDPDNGEWRMMTADDET